MGKRPDPVEWPENDDLTGLPDGAPLLVGGRLQARNRDASWYDRPNVHGIKAMHVAVVSHRLPIGRGLATAEAAACAPQRIILSDLGGDATEYPPNSRCLHPACVALFKRADQAEAEETAKGDAEGDGRD